MPDLWKIAFSIAGIGAIASFVLWSIFKEWLRLPIFQQMTKEQQYKLFRLVIILTFIFAIGGLGAHVYAQSKTTTPNQSGKDEYTTVIEQTHAENRDIITNNIEQAVKAEAPDSQIAPIKQHLKALETAVENLKSNVAKDQLTASAENRRKYNETIEHLKKTQPPTTEEPQQIGSGGGGGSSTWSGLRMVMDKNKY